MSAQSGRKKRFGSRRTATNQNETSVTQHHEPEDTTDSFNVCSNSGSSEIKTQNPNVPEVTMNRRKLGSSRRNKGRQHVKDSETELYHEPREEVEGETRVNKTLDETQTSLAVQREMQEEMRQGGDGDVSATHASALYSATTPDYHSEVKIPTTMDSQEDAVDILIPQIDHLEADRACGTKLQGIETLQREEVKENAPLVGISELTSSNVLACPSVDHQLINNQPSNSGEVPDDEHSAACSVAEPENNENDDDADLFRQEGSVPGDLVSEVHVDSVVLESITPEITTDTSSPRESTEVECSVEQAIHSSPKEELPANEEQNELFTVSEVRGAQDSKDVVNEVQDINQNDSSPQSVILDATEDAYTCTANLPDQSEIRETCLSELSAKSTGDAATTQAVSHSDDKQDVHPTEGRHFEALDQRYEDGHVFDSKQSRLNNTHRENTVLGQTNEGEGQVEDDINHNAGPTVHQDKDAVLSEVEESTSLQTFRSEMIDSQCKDDSVSKDDSVNEDEQIESRFEPSHNGRKLGSSHGNIGRESAEEYTEDILENSGADETSEMINTSLTTETTRQEEHDIILPAPQESSMSLMSMSGYPSEVQNSTTTNFSEPEPEGFIPKSENPQDNQDERDTEFKVEMSDNSVEATLEELDQSDTLLSEEIRGAGHSEEAVKEVPEEKIKATQIHEIQQIDYTSKNVIDEAAENLESVCENLTDQAEIGNNYQSLLMLKNNKQGVSNPDDKLDEHLAKQKDLASNQTEDNCHSYDTKKPQISDIERDAAQDQVDEFKSKVEEDIKPEQRIYQVQEEHFSEMEETISSLQTIQSETNAPVDSQTHDNSARINETTNTDFNHSGIRRKLGSSRRNKGKQNVKDSESYHKPDEDFGGNTRSNEPGDTALTTETTGWEKSMETMLEGMEESDISQTEEENAHIGTLVCTSDLAVISVHSSPTVDQQVIDQSHCRQVADEELSNVYSVTNTESQETGECNKLDENLLENYLVSEPHVCPIALEIATERRSSGEPTVSECQVEKTIDSSPTDEQLSDTSGAQHSKDAVKKVPEQEVKPTQMQEKSQIDYSSQGVIDDATENTEILSGTLTEQIDNEDIYQADLAVKSTEDPTAENIFEASDQMNKDYYECDKEKPQIDIERVDTEQGDVHEIKDQVKEDAKPSAERTDHQEKERVSPEMEDSESPLQSLQCETQAPLDHGDGNRKELGSIQEKSTETELDGVEKSDSPQIDKQKAHFGTFAGISDFTSSSLHSSPAVDQQLIQSNYSEMPDEGLPTVDSVTKKKGRDEDGNLQDNILSVSHVKSETMESSNITREKSQNHTEAEGSVEQQTFSSPNEKLPTNGEQDERFNSSEVKQSDDVVNKAHEEQIIPVKMQEMHQIDSTSITGSESSPQTLPTETNASLDTQPQGNSQSIKDETHTGLNTAGNKRKLGSSRRNKGRQHVEDAAHKIYHKHKKEVTENNDETPAATEMSSATVNDENTEEMPKEDTFFLHNVFDNITAVTSSSDKDDFLEPNENVNVKDGKLVKEADTAGHLPGYDTVQMGLMQSPDTSVSKDDSQNISHQVSSRSTAVEQACLVQNTETSCDKDSLEQVHSQPISHVTETVRCVTMEDWNMEVESLMDVQGPGLDEKYEDPTNKDHPAQEINTSHEQEPAVDVSDESGTPTAMDACNSQEENEKTSHLDYSENLKAESKQRRRKMGSTRKTQKQEAERDNKDERDLNTEAGVSNLDKMEVVEEAPLTAQASQNENAPLSPDITYKDQQDTNESSSVNDEEHKLQNSASDLPSTGSNVIPGTDDLMTLHPELSASNKEEVVNPVALLKVADGERNEDVSVEPSQIDFTSTEKQTTSVVAGRNRPSINQLSVSNTESTTNTGITWGSSISICETTQSTQNDEDRPESVKVTQDQDANEQKPVNEGAHNKTGEIQNRSPNLNSANRRRKMGSTRRVLGSQAKGEDLHQKQEVDNEATQTETTTGDVMTESVSAIDEKELQLQTEHKDSEHGKEKVFETVEFSHAGESQLIPLAQQTAEENPVSPSQLVETELQLNPNYLPSTSSKSDMSESPSGGRRRKMGSHRKSRGHQSSGDQNVRENRITDAQIGKEVRNITEEGAIKATEQHTEETLDKISKVESDKKPPSSISKAGEHSKPVRQTAGVQPHHAEIGVGQESQKAFSLAGNARGTGFSSNSCNVVMVGDSSVGKTSFMKRAQSGKFSLDLPASVGLDSCMWTVVVDGKPVGLELWDTAGQERFHSITRQIFHKAKAFLLMYDVTCPQSFSAVSYWTKCIQEAAAENVTVLLLGNKSDEPHRQVTSQQGEFLAKEYGYEFMECSAATGENVIQCLETVARMLSQRSDTREEVTVLHKEPDRNKRSRCC
ncbi:uncharacterized protein rab44 [Brachyistius frenatus]|uniref:uncharacterized protein rab44 n=1 Tax=Brachyistius frenatus TaxID=100188 RepID=UPI0037E958F7